MNAKLRLLAVTGTAIFLSACSGTQTAGFGPVRIETYPLDGNCQLKGSGYTIMAKAPADIVVPLSAAPVLVSCSTESGYKGAETLSTTPDPWSPANVGSSLGLGYLVDHMSSGGRRYPELMRVTMIFSEAGKPGDLQKDVRPATDAEMSKQGPSFAKSEKAMASKSKTGMMAMKSSGDSLPAAPPTWQEASGMPTPKPTADKTKGAMQKAGLPAPAEASPAPANRMPLFRNDIRVHLASFKKRSNAERKWQTLRQAHRDLLNNLSSLIETIDIKGKGRFHRVYAGPMVDMATARKLCKSLKSREVYCRAVGSGAQ